MSEEFSWKFDHFEVLRDEHGKPNVLGRGGMGVTYKARDTSLGRMVALKVIAGGLLVNDTARKRFLREARATAQLHHRNIATVFHQGVVGEACYYAMEFIDGVTLQQRLKEAGPMDPAAALDITRQVVQALSEAEKHGLVHRDIKPANIMLKREADGRELVKLIDFGLAKFVGGENEEGLTEVTVDRGFLGTVTTSSPEQCRGEELDTRSDFYSLGATLWVVLEGRPPFSHSNPMEVMLAHLQKKPPFDRLDHLPKPVVRLLRSLLEKEAARRPANTAELIALLDECETRMGTSRPVTVQRAALTRTHSVADGHDTSVTTFQDATLAGQGKGAAWKMWAAIGVSACVLGVGGWWMTQDRTSAEPAPLLPTGVQPEAPSRPTQPIPELPQPSRAQVVQAVLEALQNGRVDVFLSDALSLLDGASDEADAEAEEKLLLEAFEQDWKENPSRWTEWTLSHPIFDETLLNAAQRGWIVAWEIRLESWAGRDNERALHALDELIAHAENKEGSNLAPRRKALRPVRAPREDRDRVILLRLRAEEMTRRQPGHAERLAAVNQVLAHFASRDTGYNPLLLARHYEALREHIARADDAIQAGLVPVLRESRAADAATLQASRALRFEGRGQWLGAAKIYLDVVESFAGEATETAARARLTQWANQAMSAEGTAFSDPPEQWRPVWERAGELGIVPAMEWMGRDALTERPVEAYAWFLRAAEGASPAAMAQLGTQFLHGIGVAADPVMARHWLEKSNEAGFLPGSYLLGELLLAGVGGPSEETRALLLLEKAAESYPVAMDRLADCYRRGIGIIPNFEKAHAWYDRAIEAGHVPSLGNKGVMHMLGEGVAVDKAAAVGLFQRGSEAGDPWCMYLYARALWHGEGIPANQETAAQWMKKAAGLGQSDAAEFLKAQE